MNLPKKYKMIQNKKLGLKIAESAEEALWTNIVKAGEARIKNLEEALIVERVFLETAKKKLKSAPNNNIPLGIG